MLRSMRHVTYKLLCLRSFDAIVPFVNDKCRLQRIVPSLVTIIKDSENSALRESPGLVIARTIKSLTFTLEFVKKIGASDANIFQEYIFPVLQPKFSKIGQPASELVSIELAKSLPSLAESSRRFFEMSQLYKRKKGKEVLILFWNLLNMCRPRKKKRFSLQRWTCCGRSLAKSLLTSSLPQSQ